MSEEFNLSDYIGYVDKNHIKVGTENANAVILVEKVKEFIKTICLKDLRKKRRWTREEIREIIKHRAGDLK